MCLLNSEVKPRECEEGTQKIGREYGRENFAYEENKTQNL